MSNKNVYESKLEVRRYSREDTLQKPEQTILSLLGDTLHNMRMLDIGVGGGRTTCHFAKLVKEYVGIDYAANMIAACRKRFPKQDHISFKVVDARSLAEFPDQSFDFVLFSFNGLDYISHPDRLQALAEIRRVLKKGGIFVFSSHNMNFVQQLFSVPFSANPFTLFIKIAKFCTLIGLNGFPKRIQKKEWSIIYDGSGKFRLAIYYITPELQLQQLHDCGFRNISFYALKTGQEMTTRPREEIHDPWIYYLCRNV